MIWQFNVSLLDETLSVLVDHPEGLYDWVKVDNIFEFLWWPIIRIALWSWRQLNQFPFSNPQSLVEFIFTFILAHWNEGFLLNVIMMYLPLVSFILRLLLFFLHHRRCMAPYYSHRASRWSPPQPQGSSLCHWLCRPIQACTNSSRIYFVTHYPVGASKI